MAQTARRMDKGRICCLLHARAEIDLEGGHFIAGREQGGAEGPSKKERE